MKENQMQEIAGLIAETSRNIGNPEELKKIKERVLNLATKFPIYSQWN